MNHYTSVTIKSNTCFTLVHLIGMLSSHIIKDYHLDEGMLFSKEFSLHMSKDWESLLRRH